MTMLRSDHDAAMLKRENRRAIRLELRQTT